MSRTKPREAMEAFILPLPGRVTQLLLLILQGAALDVRSNEDRDGVGSWVASGAADGTDWPTYSTASGGRDNGIACRVAVCFSGHVRSFVYPVVHRSIRRNLIQSIEDEGCDVDIFAYATLVDTVPRSKQELNKNFTPSMAEVQAAFKIFQLTPEEKGGREGERGEGCSQFDNKNNKPRKHHPPEKDVGGRTAAGKRFELQWHHEQAGIIPNSCPQQTALRYDAYHGHKNRGQIHEREVCNGEDPWGQEKTDGLYWQLYKSLAAFRMAERRETEEGFRYDWIVRTRFDLAWLHPLPSLSAFPATVVWLGSHLWPVADPFALVPRHLADGFFSAVSAYYACDGESWPPHEEWWTPACEGGGFQESVLLRYLISNDIPHRVYDMFPYRIVRGAPGIPVKVEAMQYIKICNLVAEMVNMGFHPGYTAADCTRALVNWADTRARTLLSSPDGNTRYRSMLSAGQGVAIVDPNPQAWERLLFPVAAPGDRHQTSENATEQAEIDLGVIYDGLRRLRDAMILPASATAAARVAIKGQTTCSGNNVCRGNSVSMLTSVEDGENQRMVKGKEAGAFGELRGTASGMAGQADSGGFKESEEEISPHIEELPLLFHVDVISPPLCSLGTHPGRAPHRVSTYNLTRTLQKELVVAIKCLAVSIVGSQDAEWTAKTEAAQPRNRPRPHSGSSTVGGDRSDALVGATPSRVSTGAHDNGGQGRNECAEARSLEMVMLDVSIGKNVMGICTADNDHGLSVLEQVREFEAHPEQHCVWYGRLHHLR